MAASAVQWPEGWSPPQQWSFPPMFTLQPVAATRDKQLRIWRDLIVEYHMASNRYMLVPSQCPLFANSTINRSLSPQAQATILEYLIADGSGEWEDDAHTRVRVLWRRPDQLAGELYDYVRISSTIQFLIHRHSFDIAGLPSRYVRNCVYRV